MDKINAFVFDAYGTLFNINSLDERLAHYFGKQAEAISTTWRRKQLEYTWLRALMQRYAPFSQVTQDALTYSCQLAKVKLTDEIRMDLLHRYGVLKAYPDVPGVLQQLSQTHRLTILSNADPSFLEQAVENNQLNSYLEAVLSADTLQTFKTAPQVYQLAVDTLQLPPEQIAFVTSNPWDVAGAKSFGLITVWINRGNIPEQLGFSADHEIAGLKELQRTLISST
ncbi:MAG: haloacid dehalogenase type II [Tunicatimonas sp.]|uniref:haloacid dehalogenase type II n=1 Tax=Tunicatimonas sp. TaxID=1940096 RepID=UPI003C73C24F